MKKIIIILMLVALSGCELVYNIIDNTIYGYLEHIDYPDFSGYDLSSVTNRYQAILWVRSRVSYKADIGEYWQSPQETLDRGYGDCEDIAMLVLAVIYEALELKYELIALDSTARTVEEGGYADHIAIRYEGIVYEAQVGYIIYGAVVKYSYTFNAVFY